MIEDLRSLLSFHGRLSRLAYWRAYLSLAVALASVWCLGLLAMLGVGAPGAILLLALAPILMGSMAIVVRRLHDRNMSGWWALPLVVIPAVVGFGSHAEVPGATPTAFILGASLLSLALSIWGWVEIGFRRGTPGSNRFGDEPHPSNWRPLARR
jgi:uncharacterized membrane protein YhaH (DUF805 family)